MVRTGVSLEEGSFYCVAAPAVPRRGPQTAPELGVGIAGWVFEVLSTADKGTIVHATLPFTARTPRKDLLHGGILAIDLKSEDLADANLQCLKKSRKLSGRIDGAVTS